MDFVENSSGNYILRLKNMQRTFLGADGEDGVQCDSVLMGKDGDG